MREKKKEGRGEAEGSQPISDPRVGKKKGVKKRRKRGHRPVYENRDWGKKKGGREGKTTA